MDQPARSLSVIYCDDVRAEIGDKLSFMGVYTGDMTVPEFPFALPKLSVFVEVTTGKDQPFSALRVFLIRDGSITEQMIEIPAAEVASRMATNNEAMKRAPLADTYSRHVIAVHFLLMPFVVPGPTTLQVRALCDDEQMLESRVLRINRLAVFDT